jgi:hypothetical protein
MLGLVFADGDVRGVVEEYVGGLEDGVGEETEFEGVFVVGGVERGGVGWEGEFALQWCQHCGFVRLLLSSHTFHCVIRPR